MKYQLIFEDDDRGCVSCPYSFYNDDETLATEGEGFYCRKTNKFLGNYTNAHGLIPIPVWCKTVKQINDGNNE